MLKAPAVQDKFRRIRTTTKYEFYIKYPSKNQLPPPLPK